MCLILMIKGKEFEKHLYLQWLRIMTKSTHFQLETTSLPIGLVFFFFFAVFANIDLLVITVSVTTFKHWVKVKQNYLSRF